MIKINNLTKLYGNHKALDIPHCAIEQGEVIGLVGNNGAGKTTLFRLMLDLLEPSTGEVLLQGVNVVTNEDWKEHVGAYIDNSFLIDYLTAEEFFYFIGQVYHLSQADIDQRLVRFHQLMNDEILGKDKYIRDFSAGNKQKIGIIAAMLHQPSIVILDEPFNFLDPRSQAIIKRAIKEYSTEFGTTILISSHNLNHTIDVSTRILLLEKGLLLKDVQNSSQEAREEIENYFNEEFIE